MDLWYPFTHNSKYKYVYAFIGPIIKNLILSHTLGSNRENDYKEWDPLARWADRDAED